MGRKAIDLTGQKFNRLTVLERDTTKKSKNACWICQCECGNIVSVQGTHLKNESTKSCGCLQREISTIDLTGQKFGRLTVLKQDISKNGHAYWICQCDCGNIISVLGNNLRNGKTKSCGCLQKELISERSIIDLTGQKFGHLTVLRRDLSRIGNNAYWVCQCDCGNTIIVRGSSLKSGNTKSCGCIKSKGESKIKDILFSLNIKFVQQKAFDDLKYKHKLKFDFFLPDYNCCIEYNGIQHYEIIDYFGGEKQFEEQKKKDDIKRQWCKDNNIMLIEIPYTDYNKINEDYIKSRL